ncbi:Non-reducing end beta-L-arabinofuranosidase [Aquisphaera giovannonii]|uniref:Non-reducing end beta-L-arabinofuranosidase n=1 Tax=Aquisphaera giovannonii TaxID=406548 RepID=A0A5B9W1U5_9BACT|nr:beta-L-arabinofuranosidase domain-containing protein [Aquisphaera giovannonii]QEH34204.1 Non-reducing end beta-L-arabinofuranosidase [Aquisphaera giovannonii]
MRRLTGLLASLLPLLACPAFALADGVSVVDAPPASGVNAYYASNRPPLRPAPLIKLPVGAVRPKGWLRKQLELQADGFHGHLTEISDFLKKEGNSWLAKDGQGRRGWEEVPYWLKGFGDSAYILGRDDQVREAKVWIEAAIASQAPDGFFGPRGKGAASTVGSTEGRYDLWPNMVMLNCLQSYYEFSGDRRVVDLMTRYFRWELAVPEADFLPPFWQQQRAGDNLASVYWLYNRTGEPWLLDLATKIHRHTAPWSSGIANWHNVNMAEAFGGPTTYWQQSGDEMHRRASYRNYDEMRARYGQVPGGMFGGDENCRPGYSDPRQAVESCGMVEMMLSTERLYSITGDGTWADRCEDVAYNSLPAACTADMTALRYLTAPNMATADRRSHQPGIQNGGPMFHYDPHDHRCCQHNVGHGWPYFAENLVMATLDNGLAVVFPAASATKAKVGDGSEVTLAVDSHYPFAGELAITVDAAGPVAFPLYVRIPGWARGASLRINGTPQKVEPSPGQSIRIDRTWNAGDRVAVTLPMDVRVRTWEANHGAVSVDRGPLTFSLAIGQKVERDGGTDRWPAFKIIPTTPWNYALVLNPAQPASSFRVQPRDWPAADMPWTPEGTPIALAAEGRRVPEWRLDPFDLVAVLQQSPVKTSEPIEPISLIPMGAARIRISAFPVAAGGDEGHAWHVPPGLTYSPSASHCFESDTVFALSDGVLPASSQDREVPRHTFWPHEGTTEWVMYDFGKPIKVSKVSVYWFDDTKAGGGCALPASWRVLRRTGQGEKGDTWEPVPGAAASSATRDGLQALSFPAVDAAALRLEIQLQPGRSGGVLEWRVE